MLESSKPERLTTAEDWDNKWPDIFDHYQNDPRHAHYINAIRRRDERRILEIAAGSFRDIALLNKGGVEGYGIDFSPEAVTRAREFYPQNAELFSVQDAFNLDFSDKFFDLSYHNGFWGLFKEEHIQQMAIEQARVTRSRMVVTVHNAHNVGFANYFQSKQESDSLFNIRFFTVDEIEAFLAPVCRKVTIIPVGKGKKSHEDWLIRKGLHHPAFINTMFKYSGMKYLERSERLMCIGEL